MSVVVVGVDGSGTARAALREAVSQAAWRNASVIAVHIIHIPAAMGFDTTMIDFEALRAAGTATLDDELESLAEEYPDGLPVEIESQVRLGHTGTELLSFSRSDDYDVALTVVGSRGYGGFRGLVVGSVTSYLVHHLDTPLLIVPPETSDA